MKDQRKIKVMARGFQVITHNKEEPMNNEKAKNVKQGVKKLRSCELKKPHNAKIFLKLLESSIIKLRGPTCQVGLENP